MSGGLLVGSDVREYYMSDVVDAQLRVDTCMTEKWVHGRKVSDFGKLSNISEAKKTGMEEESITTRDNKLKTLDDEETLMLVMSRSDDDEETKETSVRETDMFAQVLPAIDSQITQFRADFPISKELVVNKTKDSVEGFDNEQLETGEVSVTESQEVFGKAPAGKSKDSEESVKPVAVEDLTKYITCQECGKQFANKAHLYHHTKAVHVIESCNCKLCGRTYKNKIALGKHMKHAHDGMVKNPYSGGVKPVSPEPELMQVAPGLTVSAQFIPTEPRLDAFPRSFFGQPGWY